VTPQCGKVDSCGSGKSFLFGSISAIKPILLFIKKFADFLYQFSKSFRVLFVRGLLAELHPAHFSVVLHKSFRTGSFSNFNLYIEKIYQSR
jgi:hypothetical protein